MNERQLDELLSPEYMIEQLHVVYDFIEGHIRDFPNLAFQGQYIRTASGVKPLLAVDLLAERFFMNCVARRFGPDLVAIYGEESLGSDPDLDQERRICILIDIVDGTDLLERDFSNWCSAILVFDPRDTKILAAFVSMRSERGGRYLYYTTKDLKTFKKPLPTGKNFGNVNQAEPYRFEPASPLKGPAKNRTLRDASLCLYAQKSGSLLALLALDRNQKLTSWLKAIDAQKGQVDEPRFRFYNLAGNPMMARLAEGVVDVVLDLRGQHPHDVVPGAYLALLNDAVLTKPNGEVITIEGLAESLRFPARSKIKYILSANKNIHEEIIDLL